MHAWLSDIPAEGCDQFHTAQCDSCPVERPGLHTPFCHALGGDHLNLAGVCPNNVPDKKRTVQPWQERGAPLIAGERCPWGVITYM